MTHLNDAARVLSSKILMAFPEWESAIRPHGPTDDRSALAGDLTITVTPPAHPAHRLHVVLRGNSAEVRYDDARPPGPAEKLFVNFHREPEAASNAVVAFLGDLTEGRIVVVRKTLGMFVRRMRGGCRSVLEFRSAREMASENIEGFMSSYTWDRSPTC